MSHERLPDLGGRAIELGWLGAVLAVPAYFNVDDLHIFEPDKAILLRDIAAVLGALALLRLALRALTALRAPGGAGRSRRRPSLSPLPAPAKGARSARRRDALAPRLARKDDASRVTAADVDAVVPLLRRPTVVPMLLLTGVSTLATVASILPGISWQGSYARGQGLLSTLAYLTMALLVAGLLSRAAQARRLGVALALAGLAPAAYGWVQHAGRDPLPWQQADLTARVPGTMGNPIFLGALLVMTIPLALWRLALALRPETASARAARPAPSWRSILRRIPRHRDRPAGHAHPGASEGTAALADGRGRGVPARQLLGIVGWTAVVVVEAVGLAFTDSRGPFAGFVVGLVVFGLALAQAWQMRWLGRASLAASVLVASVLLAVNLLPLAGRLGGSGAARLVQWSPQTSGTSEVRLLIWRPALELVARRPLLGCGPETLLSCYYLVYPTALRHIEAPNAVPDRTHNIFLDAAAETGLLGLAALLLLLATTAHALLRLVRHAAHPATRALAAALLAALAGHLVEGFFGIAVVATLLLTWLIAGLAAALTALEHAGAALENGTRPAAAPAAWARRESPGPARLGVLDRVAAALPRVAAFTPVPAGTAPGGRSAGARVPGRGRHRASEPATRFSSAATRPWSGSRAWWKHLATVVCCGACVASGAVAGAVIVSGATATAADTAARQGADLSLVARANAGQVPPPAGLSPQSIRGLRQFAAAAQAQAAAVGLAPDREEYLLDAGTTMVQWGDAAAAVGGVAATQAPALYTHALLLFGRAARLNSYDPDPLRNTGKAYERWAGLGHDPSAPNGWDQGLLERAAVAFARAAQVAPRHPDPLTSGAQVALWQGRLDQALMLAARALALDPRDGDGYRLRAEVEIVAGERRAALADWRRALADPNVGQRGPTAAHLALAEATWARQPCAALADARTALTSGGLAAQDTSRTGEIMHVDAVRCTAAVPLVR